MGRSCFAIVKCLLCCLLLIVFAFLGLPAAQDVRAQGLSFPAEIVNSFAPVNIPAGDTSLLTITLYNPNPFDLTLSTLPAALADDLTAADLNFASPANPQTTCPGGTAIAAGRVLSLVGGTVPRQVGNTPGSCTVTVLVTSTVNGNHINTIAASVLQATDPTGTIPVTNPEPTSATLRVNTVLAPSLSKSFNLNTIWVAQTSTLTIHLTNNDPTYELNHVSITDTLPVNVTVASAPASPQCNGGTVSYTSGTVTLNGGRIPKSSSCDVVATVTSTTPGVYTDTIPAGAIHTQQGVTNAGPASAPLNVQAIGIGKAFSPSNFQAGGSTTLTITLQAPAGSDYTSAAFTDNLPAGLTVTAILTNTCGGSVSATTGSITLSNGAILHTSVPPDQCSITATVTSSIAASYTNSIPIGALTAQGPTGTVSNVLAGNANLTVYANGLGLSGSKSFTQATIPAGGNSRLRITITAPADTNITGLSLYDALPLNVTISNSTAPSLVGCDGTGIVPLPAPPTLTATTGAAFISLSGGTIIKGTSCQINVYVTSSVPTPVNSPYVNTISPANISDTEHRNVPGNFSANLTVSGLSISKAFTPTSVNADGISTLTITLTNTNASQLDNVSLSGVPSGDHLPGNASDGILIAPTPHKSTTCGAGDVVVTPGGQDISMTGGTVPAQVGAVAGICTISVDVIGKRTAPGVNPVTYTNTINAGAAAGTLHNTSTVVKNLSSVSANIVVQPITIGIIKSITPGQVFGGAAATLQVDLSNPNSVALWGITFTDNLPQSATPGKGMMIANPPAINRGTCNGAINATPGSTSFTYSGGSLAASGSAGSSCSMTLSVTMNVQGTLTNTIPINAVTSGNGAKNDQPASWSLTNTPGASLSKVFFANPIPAGAGNTSTLTFTIQNTGNVDLTGMGFIDTLPAGMTASISNPAQCGGTVTWTAGTRRLQLAGGSLAASGTCTIVVNVSAPAAGNYANCVAAGALTDVENATNQSAACDTLTVITPPTISKAFAPTTIATGATSTLTFTLRNPAANTVPLTGLAFTDTFPPGMTLASVPNAAQCNGTVTSTAGSVTLTDGSLAVNSTCTVTVGVTAATGDTYPNVSEAVTSTNGGTGNTASATLTVVAPPAIQKTFAPPSILAGQTSTLTLRITNPNAGTTLTGVSFTDALPAGMQVVSVPVPATTGCGAAVFAPAVGATSLSFSGGTIATGTDCLVSVDVTASGGAKLNTTSAVTSTNGGTGNSASATLNVDGGGLLLAKSTTTTGYQAAGDSIAYNYLLTNTGSITLYPPFEVSDDHIGTPPGTAFTCGTGTETSLDPLGTITCVAAYSVQAGDISGKSVTNIATATARDAPGGNTITSNSSSVTVPLEALTLTKSTSTLSYRVANNTISYSYTLTNTGSVTLYPPYAVSDAVGAVPVTVTCPGTPAALPVGANVTCTSTYTVSGADVTAGSVTNIARATAKDAVSGGSTVTSNTSSVTVYKIIAPVISKAFSPATIPVGTTSTLTFTITNPATNAVPLTSVAFTDNLPAGVTVTLAPDAAQCGGSVSSTATSVSLSGGTIVPNSSCTVTLSVTGATAGTKNNTSLGVSSSNGGNGNTASATLIVVAPPAISKAFSPGTMTLGETSRLTFTLTAPATNTVATLGTGFSDTLPAGLSVANPSNASSTCAGAGITANSGTQAISMSGGTLASGATCTAGVDIVAAASGSYDNTTDPVTSTNGGTGSTSNTATLIVSDSADLSVTKDDGKLAVDPGEAVSYTIVVHNAGPSPVSDARVTDTIPASLGGATWSCAPDPGATCTASGSGNINDTASVPANASVTYAVAATVSGAASTDIVNSATVLSLTVTDPNTANNIATDTDHLNRLAIVKGASPTTYSTVGATITYSYTITNNGTSTLSAPFAVPDDQVIPVCSSPATLGPGASFTCSATHDITQPDLDAGLITNHVYADGRDADGDTVRSNTDSKTVNAVQAASIALSKTGTLDDGVAAPTGQSNPGDTVSYGFSIQNTGNVTLTSISVSDPLLPGLSCTLASLGPGQTASCTASNNVYTLAQADINRGHVDNTATVSGLPPQGSGVQNTDSQTVSLSLQPAIAVTKTATLDDTVVAPPDVSNVGDIITYGFTIENTGNVTLTGVAVTDPLLPGLTCTSASMEPGTSFTCTGSYALAQGDLDLGHVNNTAIASGTTPSGGTASGQDSAKVTLAIPGLAIMKEVSKDQSAWSDEAVTVTTGDTVYYRVTITNAGNVTLANVNVSDDQCTLSGPSGDTNNNSQLETSETWVYTCQVTAQAGRHDNIAIATSAQTSGAVSDGATYFAEAGALEVTKALSGVNFINPTTAWLTYTIVLKNTGNVPLSEVQATDDLKAAFAPAAFTLTGGGVSSPDFAVNAGYNGDTETRLLQYSPTNPNTLESGASGTITLVVQVINDSGQSNYTNTVDGAGLTPLGTSIQGSGATGGPGFIDPALTKAASPAEAGIGDKVTFTITVTNQGTAKTTGVIVTDVLPGNLDYVKATSIDDNTKLPRGTVALTPPRTITVTIGDLDTNDKIVIKIITQVNGLGKPPTKNTASLVADPALPGIGPDPISNDASAAVVTVSEHHSQGGSGNGPGAARLPSTGFAPGKLSIMPPQPASKAYQDESTVTLEIPKLHLRMPIVGVPLSSDIWDVTWLSNQAGWLEGTAFPSWAGNSVLTGHVYLSNGLPGPFLQLQTLAWGDQVILHVGGQRFVYQVRSNQVLAPNDVSALQHEELPWVTLLTCKDYNASDNTYSHRVAVRAVLIQVQNEATSGSTAR